MVDASSTSSVHPQMTGVHSPPYVAGTVPSGDDAKSLEAAGRFRALRLVLDLHDPAIARDEPDKTGLVAIAKKTPEGCPLAMTTNATCYHPSERSCTRTALL
ncbi:hypothetical protein EV121DRAFT_211819 [Schizophyllum commune]